jgi:addiction module HigA family antidote
VAREFSALSPKYATEICAERIGVTRQTLHRVIAGTSAITPEMALRLEKALGSTAEAWLALQRAYDLAEARRHPPRNIRRIKAA